VLLESSSIKWKSNDGRSIMCKHCKGTTKIGPKPLNIRHPFASNEWETIYYQQDTYRLLLHPKYHHQTLQQS
jgi:hypothetical protein